MSASPDEHDRTMAFAEIALGQIKAMRQPATPRHFEIWYIYATGYNTSLNRPEFFDAALASSVVSAQALREPLSLLLADIDHFKTFNDTYGHLIGDQVLRLVAMAIKQNVKRHDIAARYGGEEFAIILRDGVGLGRYARRPGSCRPHEP